MTGLFDDWGFGVGGFFFVGVDFAVVFGVEGAVCGVELFWHHGESKAGFLSLEAYGVVAAVGMDHAFSEGAGVDEFSEGGGEVVVLFVELALGADHDAHVGKGSGLGIGAGGV